MKITKQARPIKTIAIKSGKILNLPLSAEKNGFKTLINAKRPINIKTVMNRILTTESISWKNICIDVHQSLAANINIIFTSTSNLLYNIYT